MMQPPWYLPFSCAPLHFRIWQKLNWNHTKPSSLMVEVINIFKQRLRVQSDLWERLSRMEMRKKVTKVVRAKNGILARNVPQSDKESTKWFWQSKDRLRAPQVPLQKLSGGAPLALFSLVRMPPVLLSRWSNWFQAFELLLWNQTRLTSDHSASYNSWKKLNPLSWSEAKTGLIPSRGCLAHSLVVETQWPGNIQNSLEDFLMIFKLSRRSGNI